MFLKHWSIDNFFLLLYFLNYSTLTQRWIYEPFEVLFGRVVLTLCFNIRYLNDELVISWQVCHWCCYLKYIESFDLIINLVFPKIWFSTFFVYFTWIKNEKSILSGFADSLLKDSHFRSPVQKILRRTTQPLLGSCAQQSQREEEQG